MTKYKNLVLLLVVFGSLHLLFTSLQLLRYRIGYSSADLKRRLFLPQRPLT